MTAYFAHWQRFFTAGVFICTLLTSQFLRAEKEYTADYVVIGMGAAGAGVAKLLSDDPSISVIGIEAGANHDHDEPIKDPTFAPTLEDDFDPQYFYQLNQVVQEDAGGATFNYVTGRLLGGGSSINGMQYVRGTPQLYDRWQALLGKSWSTNSILQAFKSIEKYNGDTPNPAARGYRGPVDIRQAPMKPTSMATKFVQATAEATDFDEIMDYNNPQTPMGPFTRWQLFQKPNGNRESSSTAYLEPVLNGDFKGKGDRQLQILVNTTALRILFQGKKAIGVKILQDGKFGTVYARKKVIVCAGIYSPWLLQRSGIGPKDLLNRVGVKVVHHNPNVGQNLVNQFITTAVFTANPNDVGVPADDPNALYVGGAFLPDPTPPIDRNRRGFQFIGISPQPGTFVIAMILLDPKSRGNVQIQSGDPFQIPLVDDGAFSNPDDLNSFKNAYKTYIKNIAEQLHALDSQYNLIIPSLEVINDDQALEEFILANIDHTHHWSGTCRMAPLHQGGVVDRHGNVYGVKRLVVADDSIAPFIPDGNTAGCAFMIAKKIVQDIRKEAKR